MKKMCFVGMAIIGLPLLLWAGGTLLAEGHFPGANKLVDENSTVDGPTVIVLGTFWIILPAVCAGIGALSGVIVNLAFRGFVGFCSFVSSTFGRKATAGTQN